MKERFCCTNPDCAKEDKTGIVMTLDYEVIMDEKNMAQMFCPKCKSRLTRLEDTSKAAS
jgi:hypothetical protein